MRIEGEWKRRENFKHRVNVDLGAQLAESVDSLRGQRRSVGAVLRELWQLALGAETEIKDELMEHGAGGPGCHATVRVTEEMYQAITRVRGNAMMSSTIRCLTKSGLLIKEDEA